MYHPRHTQGITVAVSFLLARHRFRRFLSSHAPISLLFSWSRGVPAAGSAIAPTSSTVHVTGGVPWPMAASSLVVSRDALLAHGQRHRTNAYASTTSSNTQWRSSTPLSRIARRESAFSDLRSIPWRGRRIAP